MDRRLRRSEGANANRLFKGRWLTGKVYGQNDVLQPYDLPVTRGEERVCVRAWVLRHLITDCARRGSR